MTLREIASLLLHAALCFRTGSTASCIQLAYQAHQLLGEWLLDPARAEGSADSQPLDEADRYFWEECEPQCH